MASYFFFFGRGRLQPWLIIQAETRRERPNPSRSAQKTNTTIVNEESPPVAPARMPMYSPRNPPTENAMYTGKVRQCQTGIGTGWGAGAGCAAGAAWVDVDAGRRFRVRVLTTAPRISGGMPYHSAGRAGRRRARAGFGIRSHELHRPGRFH